MVIVRVNSAVENAHYWLLEGVLDVGGWIVALPSKTLEDTTMRPALLFMLLLEALVWEPPLELFMVLELEALF